MLTTAHDTTTLSLHEILLGQTARGLHCSAVVNLSFGAALHSLASSSHSIHLGEIMFSLLNVDLYQTWIFGI